MKVKQLQSILTNLDPDTTINLVATTNEDETRDAYYHEEIECVFDTGDGTYAITCNLIEPVMVYRPGDEAGLVKKPDEKVGYTTTDSQYLAELEDKLRERREYRKYMSQVRADTASKAVSSAWTTADIVDFQCAPVATKIRSAIYVLGSSAPVRK